MDAVRGTLSPAAKDLFREDFLSRPRYQNGCLKQMPRKSGPPVWVYRWRETDEDGKRQPLIGDANAANLDSHALLHQRRDQQRYEEDADDGQRIR